MKTFTNTPGQKDGFVGDHFYDLASYAKADKPVRVTLRREKEATVYVNGESEDTIRNIENILGGDRDDELIGDEGRNYLSGGSGNDILRGMAGKDMLFGDAGNDILVGGAGNDWFWGGSGNDILDGGAGQDDASYEAHYGDKSASVKVTLRGSQDATVYVNGVAEDTLRNIENIRGGDSDDELTGDEGDNTLYGHYGDDILVGGAGNDTLNGGRDDDTLDGGSGDDKLLGGDGTDFLDGQDGQDEASYADKSGSVKVALRGEKEATVYVNGVAEDVIRNIENIKGGSGNDELTGDDRDNVLTGGAGNDVLTGGAGADRFVYTPESLGDDVILDFNAAEGDRIDLGMETAHGTGLIWNPDGPQAWSVWMEWHAEGVVLYADLDGDASSEEFSITLRGVSDFEQSALIF